MRPRSSADRRVGPSPQRKRRVIITGLVTIALVLLGETALWSATTARNHAEAPTAAAAQPSSSPITAPITAPAADSTNPAPAPAALPQGEPLPQVLLEEPSPGTGPRSIDDPASVSFVVNKTRPIPDAASYVPADLISLRADIPNPNGFPLRQAAADALATMADAASAEIGQQLVAQSGYRSYSTQVNSYHSYVNRLGTAGADLTSARPGYSEHQTGLSVDILATGSGCSLDGPCFGSTAAGKWLATNAYRFGYILRYPAEETAVTGYEYEPWHFRYVGLDVATAMLDRGSQTLEGYFDLPAAPGYLD